MQSPSHLEDDRNRIEPQVMEGVDCLQMENGDVPCLNMLEQLRVNALRLLIERGVSPIEDGRLFLLLVHSSCKGNRDAVLRCMAE